MFEFTVLIGIHGLQMLIMNGQPRLNHPMLGWESSNEASDDKFLRDGGIKFSERRSGIYRIDRRNNSP
jgi:hypothetical protein